MKVVFYINGHNAMHPDAPYSLWYTDLKKGDIISPFNQDYSYLVIEIKKIIDIHVTDSAINEKCFYEIYMMPENKSAKISFDHQFGKNKTGKMK